jgi:hypothetical protein
MVQNSMHILIIVLVDGEVPTWRTCTAWSRETRRVLNPQVDTKAQLRSEWGWRIFLGWSGAYLNYKDTMIDVTSSQRC